MSGARLSGATYLLAMPLLVLTLVFSLLVWGASCATSAAHGTSASPAASLRAAKCGACHPVPEDHSVQAARFDEIRAAHGKRVNLSDEQWETLRGLLVEAR